MEEDETNHWWLFSLRQQWGKYVLYENSLVFALLSLDS